ncbi:hypothetical protein DFH07DRAFT_742637 [Mycena maculata]|uniref:Uncharacterized protein n=1 Tax=Mycena maculata TaxID=230809 RepID=A0AAD7J4A7_9AGAR|nr:hypothetical protein DFH07DRAFT_742637 [Mycena maculata]
MVFGLFSRKPDPKPQPSDSIQQLRTPSPSVVSSARVDDGFPPITPSPSPEHVTDPTALRALIQSIPPKILHSYTLAHLATASPGSLTYLSAFFSDLQPPPTLHCVRCHKGYFDVENGDRSCLIGHDDDSAEVERVGRGAGYETLWGCCGKTVEGDGDMGPPDGWCYEGMHTTDVKRARFRADSTIHEDKLTSCARLRCHDPLGSTSRRKRTRQAVDADSDDSDSDSDGASHSSVRTRSRTYKKARTAPEPTSDTDDVDMASVEPSSMNPSPKSMSSTRKPRAKSVSSSTSARVKPAAKSRNKPRSTLSSSNPPSPSKKPPSTRFAPSVSSTSVAAGASFSSTTTSTTTEMTQTVSVSVTPTKPPASKIKRTMQPKSKPKPKQPKRLNEVVESSIVGETA